MCRPTRRRPTILLYLLLTLAPFAIVGPFVGTVIDRFPGSQRGLIAVTNLGRAIAMVLIAVELKSLAFFPLAFIVLVLSKASSIAKSSLVPWLVGDDDRLVAENARLSRATALVGGLAGAAGAAALALGSTEGGARRSAAVMHLIAVPFAMRIPKIHVVGRLPMVEDVELRGGAVTFAANAAECDAGGRRVPRVLHCVQLEGGRRARVVLRPRDRSGRRGRLLRHLHRRVPSASSERGDAASRWHSGIAGLAAFVAPVQYENPAVVLVALTTGVAASVGSPGVRQPHAATCSRRREGPGVRAVRDPVPDRVGPRRGRRGARPAGQRGRPRRPRRGACAARACSISSASERCAATSSWSRRLWIGERRTCPVRFSPSRAHSTPKAPIAWP